MAEKRKVLITGASGYIASRSLPIFRERYELVLLDVKTTNRAGETGRWDSNYRLDRSGPGQIPRLFRRG